jgi:hypothetical protein
MKDIIKLIQPIFKVLKSNGDEVILRLWLGTLAIALGSGSKTLMSNMIGVSPQTIQKGIDEIHTKKRIKPGPDDKVHVLDLMESRRNRQPGAGRKSATEAQPGLEEALKSLVDPLTRGDPESNLKWVCKSSRRLAKELKSKGFQISHTTVCKMLKQFGYSLKSNQKILEGAQHPLRDEQFRNIEKKKKSAIKSKNPVISVDTKKKEVLGNFANGGEEWEPKGQPVKVNTHDFPDPSLDRANPYGIYDITNNLGFVNIGTDHDTPKFAVASIRAWWHNMGKKQFPNASFLQILSDCGGSNSYRSRSYKWELQLFSDKIGIPIKVCHYPPGTSKWNPIEHKMLSYISMNWRGRPLLDYNTMKNLIRSTTTTKGLRINSNLDRRKYKTGIKISHEQFDNIKIARDKFQGDWNYIIFPRQ